MTDTLWLPGLGILIMTDTLWLPGLGFIMTDTLWLPGLGVNYDRHTMATWAWSIFIMTDTLWLPGLGVYLSEREIGKVIENGIFLEKKNSSFLTINKSVIYRKNEQKLVINDYCPRHTFQRMAFDPPLQS